MKLLNFLQKEWTPIIFGVVFLLAIFAMPKIAEVIAGVGIVAFAAIIMARVFFKK